MYLQLAENGRSLADRFKPKSLRYTTNSVRYGKQRGGSSSYGGGSGSGSGGGSNTSGGSGGGGAAYSGGSGGITYGQIPVGTYSYGSSASPGLTFMHEPENPFIYVPDPTGLTGGMYVREDHFDNLDSRKWRQMMANLAPYQPTVQNGVLSEGMFLNDRASRKAKREEKKEEKKEKKETKAKQKEEKKDAKTAKKNAAADAKKSKGEAKKIAAEKGTRTGGGEIMNRILDTAAMFAPKGEATEDPTSATPSTRRKDDGDKKPFYKNPIVIGAGVLLLAGGAYALSRRSK